MAHLGFKFRAGEHEAQDLLQSFVAEKILEKELLGQANPVRGRFRTFLLNALDHFVISQRRECETLNRTDVWGVFEGRVLSAVLEDMPETDYQELIERFAFGSPSQAFHTLNTAKRMFKRHLRAVIAEYTRDDHEVEEELRELKERLLRAG